MKNKVINVDNLNVNITIDSQHLDSASMIEDVINQVLEQLNVKVNNSTRSPDREPCVSYTTLDLEIDSSIYRCVVESSFHNLKDLIPKGIALELYNKLNLSLHQYDFPSPNLAVSLINAINAANPKYKYIRSIFCANWDSLVAVFNDSTVNPQGDGIHHAIFIRKLETTTPLKLNH